MLNVIHVCGLTREAVVAAFGTNETGNNFFSFENDNIKILVQPFRVQERLSILCFKTPR